MRQIGSFLYVGTLRINDDIELIHSGDLIGDGQKIALYWIEFSRNLILNSDFKLEPKLMNLEGADEAFICRTCFPLLEAIHLAARYVEGRF